MLDTSQLRTCKRHGTLHLWQSWHETRKASTPLGPKRASVIQGHQGGALLWSQDVDGALGVARGCGQEAGAGAPAAVKMDLALGVGAGEELAGRAPKFHHLHPQRLPDPGRFFLFQLLQSSAARQHPLRSLRLHIFAKEMAKICNGLPIHLSI